MKQCYMIAGTSIRWCFIVGRGRLVSVNRRDTCLAVLVAALWGFNFVVIDWGMGSVPPLLFAAVRFSVVAVPACFLIKRPPVPWKTIVGVGGFMSLGQFGLLYLSMHLGMPPGLAALVLQAQVVFTIVIAAVALRERPSRAQVAGVALGVAGLLVVALGKGGRIPVLALALCLLAGLSWGAGNVVSRAAKAPLSPGGAAPRTPRPASPGGATPRTPRPGGLALTVWSATIVPVPLLALSLLVDGPGAVASGLAHIGWDGIASTAYTAGLASLVGYAVFNRLLSQYPSGRVVPWVLLAPVVAMGSSWALLGEVPGPAELAGALILIVGVLVSQGAFSPGALSLGALSPGRAALGAWRLRTQSAQPLTAFAGKELLLDPHEPRPRASVGGAAVDHGGMAQDHVPRLARQLDHAQRHAVDDGFPAHERGDPVGG
jgi:O-acetylserine/cysteine efflux transporter